MSYYGVSMDMYKVPDAGTPGWNLAPVPGWGANPLRSGPSRVGVGASVSYNDAVLPRYTPVGAEEGYSGDKYLEYSLGHVAFAVVGGMALGAFFTYIWYLHSQKGQK